MNLQKTIRTESRVSGKSLFRGDDVEAVFKPAPENTGIVFVRKDFAQPVRIAALVDNVVQVPRRTVIGQGDVTVETTEHCLAAVTAFEVDNLIIELNGPEMPSPGNDSVEFYKALKRAGTIDQSAIRKEYTISESFYVSEGDASIYALPFADDGLNITYDLDYGEHTGIGRQIFGCRVSGDGFEKNLAPARTFLLEAEAKQFQSKGLGKHLSPRDILVIDSDGPIKNSYRFPNECVRHKVVDLIGDLTLVGRRLRGRVVAYKSGHSLNQKLASKLVEAVRKRERIDKFGTDALLDIRRIQKILPHRYPFLLVDKVIELEGDTRIVGIKNVTFNELFFQGHFPGTPIMPGVLIVEALAQVSGLLFAQRLEHTGQLAVLLSMDNVKLRKAVVPGDQLILKAETQKLRKRTAQCSCKAFVGDAMVAEAEIKFMLVDDEKI